MFLFYFIDHYLQNFLSYILKGGDSMDDLTPLEILKGVVASVIFIAMTIAMPIAFVWIMVHKTF